MTTADTSPGIRPAQGPGLIDGLELTAACLGELDGAACTLLSDDELLGAVSALATVQRRVDALQLALAGEVGERCRPELGSERLSARKGCRTPSELLQRLTGAASATTARWLRVGEALRPHVSLTGLSCPPRFEGVADAVAAGEVGLDTAAAIVTGLSWPDCRASVDDLAAAEFELVAAARGASAECPVPATADELRAYAVVWRTLLDPDGVQPDEERAMRRRGFALGRLSHGLVTVSGGLVPEVAARLQRLFDAYLAPATEPVAFPLERSGRSADVVMSSTENEAGGAQGRLAAETRTRDQLRHDVLAVIIDAAARSSDTPTVGGAAPTVMVTVRAQDLESGRGVGWIDDPHARASLQPVSLKTVAQFTCAGGVQRVTLGDVGQVLSLGSPERCFTGRQRRAITVRDGGCIIPGCQIPAGWCEIHHVTAHSEGGATHTDNGVLLCWFHHRTIDTSGWEIRMHRGAPHIKAPP